MFDDLKDYASLHQAARRRSEDEWFALMVDAVETPTSVDGISIPLAPTKDIQAVFHGVGGKDAILAVRPLYRYVLETCRTQGLGEIRSLLDFGCGWGRFIRLFVRDVAEGGLFGVDPWTKALQMARLHFPHAAMVQSNFLPPLPFRDGFFDVVFASSVFSHLPEHLALSWILELSRSLRPGGLLIATTHSESLLKMVTAMQQGTLPMASVWHQCLCSALPDPSTSIARHAAGDYLYLDTGGGDDIPAGSYGDTFVPEGYVRDIWGRFMEVVDFVDDQTRLPQATFVLRKRA